MSRLGKFRRGPAVFFADAKSPLVRALGVRVAPILDSPVVRKALLDPMGLVGEVSWLSPVAEVMERRAQSRRDKLIQVAKTPLVTVVMAAWNAGATIEVALESICAQSYANLEVIVVDDASDDDTRQRVTALAARDPRIRLMESPHNRGAAHARNLGLAQARGEFITFHDADDTSHPERFERQLCALLGAPEKMFCLCNYSRVDDAGNVLRINGREVSKSVISMMFRRQVFQRQGYFKPLRISEDSEYYSRMKILFSEAAEVVLFKVLYLQGFSTDSLLFSDGDTEQEGHAVVHKRSAEAEASLKEIAEQHERIRRGEDDGYVAFSPADAGS